MQRTILVAGGGGFIGSHLCKKLLERGDIVVCLDNFFTGQKENIVDLLDHKYFELIRHDITDPITLDVDEIYNLACPASPIHYQHNPVQTVKTSVHGAINLLEVAKNCDAKILQASTSEVYGDPEQHPQSESYHGSVNPIGLRACYDEGKRCAETLFFDYHRQFNLDIRVARIFNTYGPKMHPQDGRVVSNFVTQALAGEDITIFGNGTQTRSFCYVDDMVRGLIALMDCSNKASQLPVNLGNPEEFTIAELADKVIKLTNSKSKLVKHPSPQDDPRQRCPDISRAKSILGWQPTILLNEGLKKVVSYFSDQQH